MAACGSRQWFHLNVTIRTSLSSATPRIPYQRATTARQLPRPPVIIAVAAANSTWLIARKATKALFDNRRLRCAFGLLVYHILHIPEPLQYREGARCISNAGCRRRRQEKQQGVHQHPPRCSRCWSSEPLTPVGFNLQQSFGLAFLSVSLLDLNIPVHATTSVRRGFAR